MGHEVVLMPPAYIKPYVKQGKNDVVDAAAIYEAMSRPDMRFVPINPAACREPTRAREMFGDRGCRTSSGPAAPAPRKQAGHMADADQCAHDVKSLANQGVHIWRPQTSTQ